MSTRDPQDYVVVIFRSDGTPDSIIGPVREGTALALKAGYVARNLKAESFRLTAP